MTQLSRQALIDEIEKAIRDPLARMGFNANANELEELAEAVLPLIWHVEKLAREPDCTDAVSRP